MTVDGAAGEATMWRDTSPLRSRTTQVTPRVEGLEATAYEIPTDAP